MARPSKYSEETLTEITDRLAKGEPLAVICRDDHMPSDHTVRNWMGNVEFGAEVSSAIARAREVGFDAIAADCLEIADETGRDTKIGKCGEEIPNSEWITRSRLRVETRLKLLAKWDPKRYGDRLELAGSIHLGSALDALPDG